MNNNNNEYKELNNKFIVIYEKDTKECANAVFNAAAEKGVSAVKWTVDTYKSKEFQLNTTNKIVILSRSLIKDCLSSPKIKDEEIPGMNFENDEIYSWAIIKESGNTIGINASKGESLTISHFLKDTVLFLTGFGIAYLWGEWSATDKEAMMDAVNWFIDNKLETFINK